MVPKSGSRLSGDVSSFDPRRECGGSGMTNVGTIFRAVRFAAVLAGALAVSACANKAANMQANAGAQATPGSPQDFLVNVGDRVFFDTDSSALSAQARATLDKQAQWLNAYSQYSHFIIEGHADERGTREYNLALGARRAQTVRDYLVSRGVAASRMRTISYGKERPVAVCDDISCWSQNRRAVTNLNANSS
jgi:peptidoglycan-associated lipoprotein